MCARLPETVGGSAQEKTIQGKEEKKKERKTEEGAVFSSSWLPVVGILSRVSFQCWLGSLDGGRAACPMRAPELAPGACTCTYAHAHTRTYTQGGVWLPSICPSEAEPASMQGTCLKGDSAPV